MKNILVLGANGSLAQVVIPVLCQNPDFRLTLLSRNVDELEKLSSNKTTLIQGDVTEQQQLDHVMKGHDIVYANLTGQLCLMANNIVLAMNKHKVKRIIWISSMGIYNETSHSHGEILKPYRDSAKIIEDSNLHYTIIRPGWFTDDPTIDYQLTSKGQAFMGDHVSRRSIAELIYKLVAKPDYAIGESLGIAKV